MTSLSGNSFILSGDGLYFFYPFRDIEGHQGQYEAVSVIEFTGRLDATGASGGHYTCDIKEKNTRSWFRTNDSSIPTQIATEDVSKSGYVILYKHI